MDFLVKNRQYVGYLGCALATVGCFLPFASVLGISVSYMSGNGKILLVAMIISAVLMYMKKEKASLIPSCIGALIFLNNAFKVIGMSGASLGIGIIVIFIGLAGAIAYPFLVEKN